MSRKAITIGIVLLTALAFTPAAEAGGPDPQCMPVYREYSVGPVTIVSRNTCSYEVYVFGEPLLG